MSRIVSSPFVMKAQWGGRLPAEDTRGTNSNSSGLARRCPSYITRLGKWRRVSCQKWYNTAACARRTREGQRITTERGRSDGGSLNSMAEQGSASGTGRQRAGVPPSGVDESVEPVLPIFGLALPALPSVERAQEEQQFMFEALRSFPRRDPNWVEIGEKAKAILELFSDRKTFDDAPLEALRKLGLGALRPGRLEDLQMWQPQPGSDDLLDRILRDLHQVRGLVWAGVARWQQKAKWDPSLDARRVARARIRKFGGLLVPETRGRGQGTGPPSEVLLLGYRQLLFRLSLAKELLDGPGAVDDEPASRVMVVSRECGLPNEWIRGWLFFDDRWERKSRTLTMERMALELLGEISEMDPDSIATSISRGRRDDTSAPDGS